MNLSGPKLFFAGLLLVALVTAVFLPVLGFDFVRWDDDINITQNPLVTDSWSASLAGRLFAADQALRFKPVHWLVNRFVYSVAGFTPAAWHALNLGLHVIAAVLSYIVLRRMLEPLRPGLRVDALAWPAAAIWAVHPLRAEPVAWATGSPYPLTAVWLLGSFACYLAAAENRATRRRWLAASWGLAVLGYGSYPVGVTYGLWLIAVDVWWFRDVRWREWRWRERWGWIGKHATFLLPALSATLVTLFTRLARPGIFLDAPSVESVGLLPRIEMALATLALMPLRVVWPVNLTPNQPPLVLEGWTHVRVIVLAAAALIVLAWLWWGRREHPRRALVGLGFAALSVPCLGLTERPTWPVDRYHYLVDLVLVGGVAGAVAGGWRETRAWRLVLVAARVGALFACGLLARQQVLIWQDSTTLFTAMARHPNFGDSPRQAGHVYVLWGREEVGNGRPGEAEVAFRKAQEAYLGGIKAALGRGDYREALSLLTHLEHHFGLSPELRRERAAWLLHTGENEPAARELRAVLAENPGDARARALLAEAAAEEKLR